jgi:hypothetical protein
MPVPAFDEDFGFAQRQDLPIELRPLNREESEEWLSQGSKTSGEKAVRNGWVEDTRDGLRLAETGRQKAHQ